MDAPDDWAVTRLNSLMSRCASARARVSVLAPLPTDLRWHFSSVLPDFDPILDSWLVGRPVISGPCGLVAAPARGSGGVLVRDETPLVLHPTKPQPEPVLSLVPLPKAAFEAPALGYATLAICRVLREVGLASFEVEEITDRILFETTLLAG